MEIRTRFAPSPTGELHVGNVRTALFNWIFTRKMKGKIILRIEDTDIERSSNEAVDSILNSLKWLDLDWDEGPYKQSERITLYKEYADKLLKERKAYYCFCSDQELQKKREDALKKGLIPGYDGKCRNLSDKEVEVLKNKNEKFTIRFKLPIIQVKFNDLVKGEVDFQSLSAGDFVIIKSNGTPSYNFACVIDDTLMNITHILRAEDHLTNTARQVLLYKELGFTNIPKFAHIPMIFGMDHAPLSKRHGATSITAFKGKGYLKEAIVNYLAILGCYYKENKEIFNIYELVENFAIENISQNPAAFDIKKLDWMNAYYIKNKTGNELLKLSKSFIPAEWNQSNEWFYSAFDLVKTSIHALDEIPNQLAVFFESPQFTQEAIDIIKNENSKKILPIYKEILIKIPMFMEDNIKQSFKDLAVKTGKKGKDLYIPVRGALTGSIHGHELIKVICLLGKEKCITRITQVL